MRKEIRLGDILFPSLKAAEGFVRAKIQNFDPADPIWPELLDRHPECREKIGVGVREFFVTPNPLNPRALQLNIRRINGSEVDISWKYCVSGKPMSLATRLASALRQAVSSQVQSFKAKNLGVASKCDQCSTALKKRTTAHVDHHCPTFLELTASFLRTVRHIPQVFADCPDSNSAIFTDSAPDRAFAAEWSEYHLRHASLRLLCGHCNLTRPKR